MRFRAKVLAGVAGLAIAGGVALVPASTSWAATPSCGTSCINIFPRVYSGTTLGAPQFVFDVFRQAARVGQPVILFQGSNTDPAEDFTYALQGTVADFYAAHLVSSSVALRYGCTVGTGPYQFSNCAGAVNDQAFELEYKPFGVDSGLCVGTGLTAGAGSKVALESCGTSARTVWIQDTNPGDTPVPPYFAAINGSDTNFSHPYVLTYPAGAYPTDKPRIQLVTEPLQQFSSPAAYDNELWTGVAGVLP